MFCAARAQAWWPLAAALGVAGTAWLLRCALRRQPGPLWLGVAALGVAYAVALAAGVDPVDPWAALYAALLLLTAELAHAAAGLPDLDPGVADAASRGRYLAALAAAVAAGFGVAELMLAAAESGGTGGAEVTALGTAAAAAALALLATTARRTSMGR